MYLCLNLRVDSVVSYYFIVNYLYYNKYGNLFILIIITIPYNSDGIYVEYLIHMPYIRTIKMFILCRITTHEYVY